MASESGVMISLTDPATPKTRWWVRCDRKQAIEEVAKVVHFHRSWFAEHGLRAEYGTCEGDTFTPSETLDTSGIKV